MGGNMVVRALANNQEVVVFDHHVENIEQAVTKGAVAASSPAEIIEKLGKPRAVWLMIPHSSVEEALFSEQGIVKLLGEDDIVIDGGNSYFRDSIRRAERLSKKGIHYLDVGVSGGVVAADRGYTMMVGGPKKAFDKLEPFLQAIAYPEGYGYFGPSGSGHFVKMVHNAIEYGMMEAIAEGFEFLSSCDFGEINKAEAARIWNKGSIIQSFLMDMAESALRKNPSLEGIKAYVEDSGEGRWAVQEMINCASPGIVLTAALFRRFRSRQEEPFSDRLLAAIRNEFGGHEVKKK